MQARGFLLQKSSIHADIVPIRNAKAIYGAPVGPARSQSAGPPRPRTIAGQHLSPRKADRSWGMAELIKVSCRMADTAGFPPFPGCEATPYPELLGGLPARERRLFHPELETLVTYVANKIQAVESV